MRRRKSADDYEGSEKERQHVDPPRSEDERSPYERDRSRIIHSASFRRLQAKTQVFGMGGSDFFRTRLTHSLEVAQIGKGIALRTETADPDLVETVCLAHDIGHPPFGHAGEFELQEQMKSVGGFEANAQNLRVIRFLEVKNVEFRGLNLTRATVDGILKYKKSFTLSKGDTRRKFYYDDDEAFVEWACEGRKDRQSFECQIMDWADDIAYSVHDLEDGFKAGMLSARMFEDKEMKNTLRQEFEDKYAVSVGMPDAEDWSFIRTHLQRMDLAEGTQYYRKGTRKTAVADLINYFIGQTTWDTDSSQKPSRYQGILTTPKVVRRRCYLLKEMVWANIINNEKVATLEHKAKKIVGALFKTYSDWEHFPRETENMFPPDFQELLAAEKENGVKTRLACDYVSGMTDAYALRMYSRLTEPDFSSLFDIV